MTDMIKRLLSWSGTPFDDDAHQAADRIEELERSRKDLEKLSIKLLNEKLRGEWREPLVAELEAAEAKLTKAVEAIEMMLHRYLLYCGGDAMPFGGHTDQKIVESVRATLAEVKGESHE